MTAILFGRPRLDVVLAWLAAFGGGVGLPDTSADECNVDTKDVKASANCIRSGFCGPIDCCYAEVIAPAHQELVPGTKRIVSTTPLTGRLILRRCDPPVYFFGFLFGRYECEIEREEPLDGYFRYVLANCPEDETTSGRARE
jgi:hypothetical protein